MCSCVACRQAGKRGRDESEAAGQAGAGEESILAKRLRYDEKRQQRRAVEAGEDDEPEGPEAAPGGAAGSMPQGMELPAGAVADAAALGVEREDEDEDDDEDSENESDRVVGGRSGAVGNTRAGASRGGPARNQSAVAGFAATASSASAAAAAAPGSGGVPVEQLSKKARKKRRKQAAAARAGAQSGGPPPVAREPAKTVPATGMGGML